MDADSTAIEHVLWVAASLAPTLPPENFRVERIEALTLPDDFAGKLKQPLRKMVRKKKLV